MITEDQRACSRSGKKIIIISHPVVFHEISAKNNKKKKLFD